MNQLDFYYLNLPIQYQYWKKGRGISFGPVFSYQLAATHRFKVADNRFNEKAPVENKFRWGLGFDIMRARQLSKKQMPVTGLGVYYQVSDLVNTGSAFHPLQLAIKWGLGIGRSR